MYRNKEADILLSKMQFSTPPKVANTAHTMLDKIQHLSAEDQILGICALFLLFCDRYGFEHHGDVLGQVHNYMYRPNLSPEFRGLKRYFKEIYD